MNSIKWTRHEYLSDIVDAVAYAKAKVEDKKKLIYGYKNRMIAHLNSGLNMFATRAVDYDLRNQDIFVSISTSGKISGVDLADGLVLWSIWRQDFTASSLSISGKSVLVIGKCADIKSSLVLIVDIITGTIHDERKVHGDLISAGKLGDLQCWWLLDARDHIYVHPVSPACILKLEADRERLYLYHLQRDSGILWGGVVGLSISREHGLFELTRTWKFRVPEGSTISAVSAPDPSSIVASQGRVLGDRSVLLKYLNPNMVSLLAKSEDTVSIFLLDVVTGGIIYMATHSDGFGKLSVVQFENRVVYSFLKDTIRLNMTLESQNLSKHNQIVVLELFTNSTDALASSFLSKTPTVISNAFTTEFPIDRLSVTRTKHGIASREVIALSGGMLFGVSPHVLDARRHANKSSAYDIEEGLYPYYPYIGVNGEMIYSKSGFVYGKRILSIPSSLGFESKSLVIVYGEDLFTRAVYPSGQFDMLGDSFDYLSLIVTIVVLIIAIFLASYYADRKELNDAWR